MNDLILELEKRSGLEREKLIELIRKKQEELSGLISEEGAIYLVAKNLGIDLLDKIERRLKIGNIVSGMKRVNTIGRIFKVSPIIEFERKDGNKGKVVSIYVGDYTGYVRIPLWNDQIKLIEDERLKVGDVIRIVNCMARENVFGEVELVLGRYGHLSLIGEEIELPSVRELNEKFLKLKVERKRISEITIPGNYEIRATIVHIFRQEFFFKTCPLCGITIQSLCETHGEVEPSYELLVSCIVDDGTSSIRVVFFREQAEKLLKLKKEEIINLPREERLETVKDKLLGKELIIRGKVKKNKMFDRLEMIVKEFEEVNVKEECEKLLREVKLKVGG